MTDVRSLKDLSDRELLALLLTGPKDSRYEKADLVLSYVEEDLTRLYHMEPIELVNLGLNKSSAEMIAGITEMSKRQKRSETRYQPVIRGSRDAYDHIARELEYLDHEEFWLILLNRGNRVIRKVQISSGGMAGTVVDSKIVFRRALEFKSSGIILCHNHPSGNMQPSQADIELTRKLKSAGEVLDITVLDHILVAGSKYFSFADEGLM
jgi:DNA repair protein RadC